MNSANGNAVQNAPQGASEEINPFKRDGNASVALGQLFQRTSKSGKTYLVGRLGTAKIVIVNTGTHSKGNRVWEMFLGEIESYVSPGAAELAREVGA
jgi:hypothetical protein